MRGEQLKLRTKEYDARSWLAQLKFSCLENRQLLFYGRLRTAREMVVHLQFDDDVGEQWMIQVEGVGL